MTELIGWVEASANERLPFKVVIDVASKSFCERGVATRSQGEVLLRHMLGELNEDGGDS